jgi:ankyrin repeat protein
MGQKRKSSDSGLVPKPKWTCKTKTRFPKCDPVPLDDFLLRHPSLSETIFDILDDKTLVKCRLMNKIWCDSIDEQRNTWIKMIQSKYSKKHLSIFQKDWRKVFHRTPIEFVKELALTVKRKFKGDSIGNHGLKPLHFAAMSGNLELYTFINAKVENKFPMMEFETGIARYLVEVKTPLDFASEYGHLEIVRYIIRNVDVQNIDNPYALRSLCYAAKNGHIEVYKYLDEHFQGQEFKENEKKDALQYSLWIATLNGHLDVVKYILRNFESKNPVKNDGQTLLHLAARKGHLDICKFILSHNLSNCNPKSETGQTPLHNAAEFGHLEVFELIANILLYYCNNCSSINPKKKDGSTPLHKAAKNGHLQICKYILTHLESKNPTDKKGEALLHSVAIFPPNTYSRDRKIQFEVYKRIAESVEDKNPSDNLGLIPFQIAKSDKRQKHDILEKLPWLWNEDLSNEDLSEKKEKVPVESSDNAGINVNGYGYVRCSEDNCTVLHLS